MYDGFTVVVIEGVSVAVPVPDQLPSDATELGFSDYLVVYDGLTSGCESVSGSGACSGK